MVVKKQKHFIKTSSRKKVTALETSKKIMARKTDK